MYICFDVGGTKTLIAVLDKDGNILEQTKIHSSQDYNEFLKDVSEAIESFNNKDFEVGIVGLPGPKTDRERGVGIRFYNLAWLNVSIGEDIAKICNCKVFIENDAKLAGLSEAALVKDQFSRVLCITVGTGLGTAIIDNMKIDISAGDAGGGALMVQHDGKYVPWESFASGNGIFRRYGKMAKDIIDEQTWRNIGSDLAEGIVHYVSIFQPDVVIIGGGVGAYFDRFGSFLEEALNKYQLPLIDPPKLMGAKRPEEAGIYGCYELAKQKVNHE